MTLSCSSNRTLSALCNALANLYDEGNRVMREPAHAVLVYMEKCGEDRKRECKVTLPPSSANLSKNWA